MPLYHWEVCLEADRAARYIPFDGQAPGSELGKHSIRLGTEHEHQHAIDYALGIFPLARVVAVYETNILGDRIRQVLAPIKNTQAVLAIIKDGEDYESVTVFVPYQSKPSATKLPGFYGLLDIVYSWRATYLMLDRPESGYYTGTPLPNEEFIVVSSKDEALAKAKAMYAHHHKR